MAVFCVDIHRVIDIISCMNRIEQQVKHESMLRGDRYDKACEVFESSGLHKTVEKIQEQFSNSFPRLKWALISTRGKVEGVNVFTGAMLEIEWNANKHPKNDSFYYAKVAKIKISPDGQLYFGSGKILGKTKISIEEWRKENSSIIEESLLKLMNSTKKGLYIDINRRPLSF